MMYQKEFADLSEEEYLNFKSDYHQSAAIVRGNILNAVTDLEMSIDLYITNYFANDAYKGEELMNLIISPRMTFEQKVQALMVLIERHDKKILDENPSMNKHLLDIIIGERNILAHFPLDATPQGIRRYYETSDLTFFKFKNVREGDGNNKKEIKLNNRVVYDVSKAKKIITLINLYYEIITMAIPIATPLTI